MQADRAAGTLLGVPEDDLVGRQIAELASPGSREATQERVASFGSTSVRRTQLIDLEHADGTDVSVEVASTQIVWDGRDAEQITLTHVPDLSARLRRLVTGVLSEITDAVVITDLHFHLRSWNKAAERLYGWTEREVIGRHVLDVLQWAGDDGALARSWQNLEVKGRWKGKTRHVARDGSLIDVLASTTVLRDDSGAPIVIVSVNRPTSQGAITPAVVDTFADDEIRAGIADDEFEVFYQPVVALADARVATLEALVRWNHPERGLLTPEAFIGAAEHCGAIVELGDVVLEKACLQVADWRRAGYDIDLAVNLSARQLSDPALVERITATLAFAGLEPDKLWLEITETSLVDEVDRASEVLYRLSDLGVGIAIDDFGTGWASLTYLRSFPVHVLKIDRSFIAGVGRNANDTAIVRSILSLGAELGLFVVAEGIETRAQQQALRKLGCTLGQGFLFGEPKSASTTSLEHARTMAPPSTEASGSASARAVGVHRVDRPVTVPRVQRLSTAEMLAPLDGGIPADLVGGDAVPRPPSGLEARSPVESTAVITMLRGLLRISGPEDASRLLETAIEQILPGASALQRERLRSEMADDASHAVELLRRNS